MTYCVPKERSVKGLSIQFNKHDVNKTGAQNLIVRDEHRLRDTGNSRTGYINQTTYFKLFWKTVPGNSSCFTQVLQLCFLRVGSIYAHSLHSGKLTHNAQNLPTTSVKPWTMQIQWCIIQRTMLQRTNAITNSVINKIGMLQRTRRNTIVRRSTRVSGLPALIGALVIIFVIVCKVNFSV
jgi:hypothetical protein